MTAPAWLLVAGPPRTGVTVIRPGVTGWAAWALQRGLIGCGYSLAKFGADGYFTKSGETEQAVRDFQGAQSLEVDGIAGPATQNKMIGRLADKVDQARAVVPNRFLRGLALSESGQMLIAVNSAIPGGLDEGAYQIRCYGPPYDGDAVSVALDPLAAARWAADRFARARQTIADGAWVKGNAMRLGQCSALYHNWPAGAVQYADNGHVDNPDKPASWIPRNAAGVSIVHFPNGDLVETQQDWANFYIAQTTQFVIDWGVAPKTTERLGAKLRQVRESDARDPAVPPGLASVRTTQ